MKSEKLKVKNGNRESKVVNREYEVANRNRESKVVNREYEVANTLLATLILKF